MSESNANASWWTKYTALFSDEHRATLLTDETHDSDTHYYIYHQTPEPPEHHSQLLDALQLGDVHDSNGLFRTRLDHSFTSAGRHTLRKWLEHPLLTAEDIQLRRSLREVVISDGPHKQSSLQDIRSTLASMEEAWRALTWCWHDDKSKTELLNHLLFGNVFTPLNNVPLAQNAYHHMRVVGTPLIQCLAPLVPVVLSYVMLKWMGADMSFGECWQISSGIFKNAFWFDQTGGSSGRSMLMSTMRVVKWLWWLLFIANIVLLIYQSYRHYSLLTHVHRRVYQAAKWIQFAESLVNQTIPSSISDATTQTELASIVEWVKTASPSHGIFTNAHGFLSTYSKLRSNGIRQLCESWVRHVGVLDASQSVTRLLEHDTFVIPEIVSPSSETRENTPPTVDIKQAFHPILDADKQTRHDLTLDKHVVLTGANASGKSTVLKTLLLNVLLAQTWGVACAASMKWTPFGVLRGYLHTVDDCGRESLFQAQIRRIEAFITAARDAKKTSVPSLLVIDEILNSTNPIEAMLLSYQYARIVGDDLSDTSRMAMTTHYPVLTTLANKYPAQFANWAMGPEYSLGVGNACHASSAIGTVQAMTNILDEDAHKRLTKAYKRMYKRLHKMKFKELDNVFLTKSPDTLSIAPASIAPDKQIEAKDDINNRNPNLSKQITIETTTQNDIKG